MASAAAGSVRYWAAALAVGRVAIDGALTRLPLRHSHHRYRLQASDGSVQTLTIPLDHATATMTTPMREVRIAEHGRWRAGHWGAIYSAYGRSPFFDFIADDLHRVLVDGRQRFLLDLNNDLQQLIVDWADLPISFDVVNAAPGLDLAAAIADVGAEFILPTSGDHVLDMRGCFTDKNSSHSSTSSPPPCRAWPWPGRSQAGGGLIVDVPYYQVWQQRAGVFTPALSVLDLLMNTGREAILTLRSMHKS